MLFLRFDKTPYLGVHQTGSRPQQDVLSGGGERVAAGQPVLVITYQVQVRLPQWLALHNGCTKQIFIMLLAKALTLIINYRFTPWQLVTLQTLERTVQQTE